MSILGQFMELVEYIKHVEDLFFNNTSIKYLTPYIENVENSLKRLKEYDEIGVKFATLNDEKEKKLQALEILKNKDINIGLLKISEDLEDYKFMCDCDSEKDLIQEEYNLLKEVLL